MTNREKFKEVYGFELEGSPCVAPEKVCDHYGECGRCPFKGWWDKDTTESFTASGRRYTAPHIDTIYMKDGLIID
jgi:hypothetical protein